jgi:hypothetical protein
MISNWWNELVRRGVLRALGAYGVAIWLLAQGLVDLLPAVGLPEWSIQAFLFVSAAATPLVCIVAWKYDLTLKGFLPDRQDVAIRQRAAAGSAANPTTRVSPRSDAVRSIVIAAWRDEKGNFREKEFDTRFQVGRDFQADIRIWDDRVSRRHLEIYPVGDDWFIRDLASLNGSYVDGNAVEIMKIDKSIEVALDRAGPRLQLSVRVMHDTMMSAMSEEPTKLEQ